MRHDQPSTQVGTENKYGYNGKELNDDFNLNLHDYGARWYDAAIGRWHSVDPHAENYLSHSGYAYVTNNPLFYNDPTGMDKEAVTGGTKYTGQDAKDMFQNIKNYTSYHVTGTHKFLNSGDPTIEELREKYGKIARDTESTPGAHPGIKKGEILYHTNPLYKYIADDRTPRAENDFETQIKEFARILNAEKDYSPHSELVFEFYLVRNTITYSNKEDAERELMNRKRELRFLPADLQSELLSKYRINEKNIFGWKRYHVSTFHIAGLNYIDKRVKAGLKAHGVKADKFTIKYVSPITTKHTRFYLYLKRPRT